MNTTVLRVISAGLFFLFIFISGFWLSRIGKPYHAVYLNIHKLISLAALVFLALSVSKLQPAAALNLAQIAAIAGAGVFFLATIITGGLASIDRSMPAILTRLHHVLPYLTVAATATALYLLVAARGVLARGS